MAKFWAGFFIFFVLTQFGITAAAQGGGDVRGLFVTADGAPGVYANRQEIQDLVDFAKKTHVQILFVQVYKANRAWFASDIADASPYKAALEAMGEDPLALLIERAHQSGIEVHAWVNLLSLGSNQRAPLLKKYGPDILTRNTKEKKTLAEYRIDGQYFLEPGDPRVGQELSALVKEILVAYPELDGIQFDYIRYPDVKPHYGYAPANAERFKKTAGVFRIDDAALEWKEWKRDQVTELLSRLVDEARAIRPRIKVSATGCMPYARALHEAFQDWPAWVDEGIVDFVTVMNYSIDPTEYGRWIAEIKKRVKNFNKVYIAYGAYKPETSLKVFREESDLCAASGAGACVVFYYSSLIRKPVFCALLSEARAE